MEVLSSLEEKKISLLFHLNCLNTTTRRLGPLITEHYTDLFISFALVLFIVYLFYQSKMCKKRSKFCTYLRSVYTMVLKVVYVNFTISSVFYTFIYPGIYIILFLSLYYLIWKDPFYCIYLTRKTQKINI